MMQESSWEIYALFCLVYLGTKTLKEKGQEKATSKQTQVLVVTLNLLKRHLSLVGIAGQKTPLHFRTLWTGRQS